MIQDSRLRRLNNNPIISDGRYVLYWMQASQRTRFNHALEYAIAQGNAAGLPVVVGFGLMDAYPEANARHYAFMLQGLRDVAAGLRRRGINFVVRRGRPQEVAVELGRRAALIVCDRGYTRHQRAWRDHVADHAQRSVVEIESDVIVPAEAASPKQEFAARTLRPKLHRLWPQYLLPLGETRVKHPSARMRNGGDLAVNDPADVLSKLTVDRSVPMSSYFEGGEAAGRKRLNKFVAAKLTGYGEHRGEPAMGHTSALSAYLHFGHLSPLEMALAVRGAKAPAADREAYLEELAVRRELAVNYVQYCPKYDSYDGLPAWARETLDQHRRDPRPYDYPREQLEAAATHDPYWNAAQREMNRTGFMHNSMRMYWGKRVLEWGRTPEEAYETLIWLNNRWFLCGRSPNAWANVGWIFGLHDRPWAPQRPIFGTVRYMNAAGLERKFDIAAYVRKVQAL